MVTWSGGFLVEQQVAADALARLVARLRKFDTVAPTAEEVRG